jgi:lipopolysaccharide heptosyltransferase I
MLKSILIVKLSSLGDVLHALPAAQALRAAHPGARIGWAVERAYAPIVRGQPWLDEVIEWDRGTKASYVDFIRRLRGGRWQTAIDLQYLFRSGLITRLSGARRRIGFRQAREMARVFYNETVEFTTLNCHAVERSLELVAHLGAHVPGLPLDRPYVDDRPPARGLAGRELFPLCPTAADHEAVDAWFRQQRVDPVCDRLIVLNPHCRRPANVWPWRKFADLARRLASLAGVRVVLTGGAVARSLCDQIAAAAGCEVLRADARFSLLGSAVLFSQSKVVVTGDTGPMHLAAAVEVPTVALLGATAPALTGPYAADAVVLRKRLDCAPCLAKRCPLKFDPPLCMDQITVDEVFAAVLRQLEAGEQQRRASA